MTMMRWIGQPALALIAGLLLGSGALAQEKPKNATVATKDAKKETDQPKPRIAVFRLAGSVQETPREEVFNFGGETATPLETLVSRLDKAAKDSSVKAVVILLDRPSMGSAQIEELRQAIARVRSAGKEVIAHADSIASLGQYSLLSAASRLSVVPTADLWITGLYGESPYLRKLLDKLGVKPDFMTCGDYKSAGRSSCAKGPARKPRPCRTGCSTASTKPR